MSKLLTQSKTAFISIIAASAIFFAGTALAGEGKARFKPGPYTIAEIAGGNGNFTTLVAALSCTSLVGAVADPDAELTVFAPTDDAFGTLNLNAENICETFDVETLTDILLYHVVGERRPSPSVVNGMNKEIVTLSGGSLYPAGMGSLVIGANNSTVNIVAADILASNGIIHVIDFVLLP
jgi:transforming growth factor-beta-induced protein